jgi:hypothetical protein
MDKFVKEAWLENGSGSMFVFVGRWAFSVTEYLTKGNDQSYISGVLDDRALAHFHMHSPGSCIFAQRCCEAGRRMSQGLLFSNVCNSRIFISLQAKPRP